MDKYYPFCLKKNLYHFLIHASSFLNTKLLKTLYFKEKMLKQVQHDGFTCQGYKKQVGLPAGSPEPGWPVVANS
jgi:hypothetical protein